VAYRTARPESGRQSNKFQRHQVTGKTGYTYMGQLVKETLAMFGLESMSRTRKVQTHRGWGGGHYEQSKVCSSFSFTSRGCSQRICPGRPNSQFRSLQQLFKVTARKLIQSFGDKRTGFCITTMRRLTLPFHQETFDQKLVSDQMAAPVPECMDGSL
jgi:hypothetical protein